MRRYKANLDSVELKKLADEIEKYKISLKYKCQTFVSRLADEGITVARSNLGDWNTIAFSKVVNLNLSQQGADGYIHAASTPILVQWMYYGTVKDAWVSPLLMAEFGSGQYASDASGQPNAGWAKQVGAGRGTFPKQKHAFEPVWTWQDLNGDWNWSSGEEPTMPIYKAATRMRARIKRIAWEVFHT